MENSFDGYHALSTHQRYFEMVTAARGGEKMARRRAARSSRWATAMLAAGGAGTEALFGRALSDQRGPNARRVSTGCGLQVLAGWTGWRGRATW